MLKNIIDKILKFYLGYFLIRGKNNRWVDEWIRSALNAKARYGDTPPHPWKPYGFFGLTSDLFIPKVFRAIQKTKELGLDFNKLLKYNPQDYRYEGIFLCFDLKKAKIPKEKRMELVNFLFDVLKKKCPKDPFALKSNLSYKNEEIAKILRKAKWIKDRSLYSVVTKLGGVGMNLAWALWTDIFPGNSYEISGPYDVSKHFGKNHILLMRHFYNLRPVEIWPHTQNWKYNSFIILDIHKSLKCEIDLLNHLTYKGNPGDTITQFACFVDERPIGLIEEIINLRKEIEKYTLEQMKVYQNLDFEEKKKKFLAQRAFRYRDWFKALGLDWQPTKEEYDRVKGKPIPKDPILDLKWEKTSLKTIKHLVKLIDPREDYWIE